MKYIARSLAILALILPALTTAEIAIQAMEKAIDHHILCAVYAQAAAFREEANGNPLIKQAWGPEAMDHLRKALIFLSDKEKLGELLEIANENYAILKKKGPYSYYEFHGKTQYLLRGCNH